MAKIGRDPVNWEIPKTSLEGFYLSVFVESVHRIFAVVYFFQVDTEGKLTEDVALYNANSELVE